MLIQVLAIVGLLLSIYSVYVKKKISKIKNYKALCDISKNVSCTKAFSSKYGSLVSLPNSVYGIFFYLIIIFLANYGLFSFIFYLSLIATIGSIYLAYVSYFKLKNYCVVCGGVYVINFLIFIFSYLK